jgi:hypothetical protein
MFSVIMFADAGIKFTSTEIDFGEIESGETVDVKYTFENTGDQLLIIKNVSASCGCTATKLEKREFRPGEKGEIPTKFFSRGYSGKVIKTVTVTTNDPKNKHTILKIKGEVKLTKFALIELLPDKIQFETVKLGEKYTQEITIKNPGTIELRIVEVIHAPEISPSFPQKIIPAGEEVKVNIVYTPMEPGKFSSFLKMRTTAHRKPISLVRLSADVPDGEDQGKPKDSDEKDGKR